MHIDQCKLKCIQRYFTDTFNIKVSHHLTSTLSPFNILLFQTIQFPSHSLSDGFLCIFVRCFLTYRQLCMIFGFIGNF